MLTDGEFLALVEAAGRAPSADNMQAWELGRRGDAIELFLARPRVLPTDVGAMFAWVGLGAALENVVIAAARLGLATAVEHGPVERPVVVRLSPGATDDPLADRLLERATNRGPFDAAPLAPQQLARLTESALGLDAGVHWIAGPTALASMAAMDARSTFIRLEHRPLRDEVFGILRFTQRELERTRFGLDFASLGLPSTAVSLARLLRHRPVVEAVSRLGVGRLVARALASRLRAAGALCLVTARRPAPAGYVEAGRAMERIWLTATAMGLAVQPHGVLPQYLTKVDVEPDTFLPRHAAILRRHRGPFDALFPGARTERPAIVLRLGRALAAPHRSPRLPLREIVRASPAPTHPR